MERSFSRDLAALGQVFQFVDEFAALANLSSDDVFPFRLAIEEVFVNMVQHNPDGDSDIGITLLQDPDRLVVVLRDSDTPPYDITKHEVAGLDAPLHDRTPGGLGIHLVRHLMDEVSYSHHDRETRIRLTKQLPRQHAADRAE